MRVKPNTRKGTTVLGHFIDALTWDETLDIILTWVKQSQKGYVCLCNVHSAVTALDNNDLRIALMRANLVLPDGEPIAWVMRKKGFPNQNRLPGPDLMLKICQLAEDNDIKIFLFGSKEPTLDRLATKLKGKFPKLHIAGIYSPKYGDWSDKDVSQYINVINQSGAKIVFVGIGCPKQEIWMSNNSHRIEGLLFGVGAAFDFHAGSLKRAPALMQKLGLEWLHRLVNEPKRLWKRYLTTNTKFIMNLYSTLRDKD